jgi:UTP--glucose-1-phosphate uridylyltransferase
MSSHPPVRKAVIPAAGLGTRCLPLTKAVPKELLPVYDRPALELIAQEAVDSGINTLVLVTASGKSSVEDHFDTRPFLEQRLEGKPELLSSIQRFANKCRVVSVRQGEPLGLGHAVGCADIAVGAEPFAVMLPDDLLFGDPPGIRPLIDVYERTGKGVVLLMEVPRDQTNRYGIVAGKSNSDGTISIDDLVEKPDPSVAPTNLAIVGRYVFPPSLFDKISATAPGTQGEIQLTDAMQALAREEGLLGVMLNSKRIDAGSILGLFEATLFQASLDPKARALLIEYAGEV